MNGASTCIHGAGTCINGASTCIHGAGICIHGASTCIHGASTWAHTQPVPIQFWESFADAGALPQRGSSWLSASTAGSNLLFLEIIGTARVVRSRVGLLPSPERSFPCPSGPSATYLCCDGRVTWQAPAQRADPADSAEGGVMPLAVDAVMAGRRREAMSFHDL